MYHGGVKSIFLTPFSYFFKIAHIQQGKSTCFHLSSFYEAEKPKYPTTEWWSRF